MSRRGSGSNQAATVIAIAADIMAGILGLWILMALLDANQGNELVSFIQDAAGWLAGWSDDLFTMDAEWLRTLLNYGLPALIYLFIGHAVAGRIRQA